MKITWLSAVALCCLIADGQSRNSAMKDYWRDSSKPQRGNGYYRDKGTAGGDRTTSHNSKSSPRDTKEPLCTEAGFFASQESCEKFFRCVDWYGDGSRFSVFHFDCPKGTVFDVSLSVCNFRYAANRPECLDSNEGSSSTNTGQTDSVPGDQSPETEGSSTEVETSGDPDSENGNEGIVNEESQEEESENGNEGIGNEESQEEESENGDEGIANEESQEVEESSNPEENKNGQQEENSSETTGSETDTDHGESEVVINVLSQNNSSYGEEVFTVTCFEDGNYRTHPLYCNMYYNCVYDKYWKLRILTCQENHVFNETFGECSKIDEIVGPTCQLSPYETNEPVEFPTTTTLATTTFNQTVSEETTTMVEMTSGPETSTHDSETTTFDAEMTTSDSEMTTTDVEATTYSPETTITTTPDPKMTTSDSEMTSTAEPTPTTTIGDLIETTVPEDFNETTTVGEVEELTTLDQNKTIIEEIEEALTDLFGETSTEKSNETITEEAPETTTVLLTETTTKNITVHPASVYECPELGYFPFEGDCVRFYKCVETEDGQLLGLLYRCPEGYGYSEDMKRCLKEDDLQVCDKLTDLLLRDVEATVLTPLDLLWFFND